MTIEAMEDVSPEVTIIFPSDNSVHPRKTNFSYGISTSTATPRTTLANYVPTTQDPGNADDTIIEKSPRIP